MAIRIRQKTGKTVDVPADEAVEILDVDGRPAIVIITRKPGSMQVLMPGDPLFTGYCRAHGLKPAKVQMHAPFNGVPMGSLRG